jgi:hypothetical protein
VCLWCMPSAAQYSAYAFLVCVEREREREKNASRGNIWPTRGKREKEEIRTEWSEKVRERRKR